MRPSPRRSVLPVEPGVVARRTSAAARTFWSARDPRAGGWPRPTVVLPADAGPGCRLPPCPDAARGRIVYLGSRHRTDRIARSATKPLRWRMNWLAGQNPYDPSHLIYSLFGLKMARVKSMVYAAPIQESSIGTGWSGSKRRLSQFPGEAACNQEETVGLERGLDDEALAVVSERQALVLQDPGVAALDRPAALGQT